MSSDSARRLLFITWDGPQTSYLEGLFLPILARLKDRGHVPHVLQFGWGPEEIWQRRAELCRQAGIPYRRVIVLRRIGAVGPFLTAIYSAGRIRRTLRDWQIDTIMPRSLMPALAVLRLGRRVRSRLKVVFDADGLAADERVDFGGLSPNSTAYRLLRDIEAQLLRSSDAVLCRSRIARDILVARAGAGTDPDRFHVVSNGIDPHPYQSALRNRPSRDPGITFVYSGSIGAQYCPQEILKLVAGLRDRLPKLLFHIYTPALNVVTWELTQQGLRDADWITLRSLDPCDLAQALVECDIGIALRLPRFSTQAVSPIKIGEYLMAGLPVIGTLGAGNTAPLTAEGVFHPAPVDRAELDTLCDWLMNDYLPNRDHWKARSHQSGLTHFSLEQAAEQYHSVLDSLNRPKSANAPK